MCKALLTAMAAFLAFGSSAWPQAQEVKRGVGNWDPDSGLGNHRAVVHVASPSGVIVLTSRKDPNKPPAMMAATKPAAVRVRIPWRRRDDGPEKKNLLVFDAATGERVPNVIVLSVSREAGDLVFEPRTVPGDYYVYFMPYKSEGRKNYPNVKYDPPQATADPAWLTAAGLGPGAPSPATIAALREASVIEIQSVDEFSSFHPMEVIATAAETAALLEAHPGASYLLFPEDRGFSIRMTGDLPLRWIQAGPATSYSGQAARGEYFTFQIGFWAARTAVEDIEVRFSGLEALAAASPSNSPAAPDSIPASAMTCLNTGGIGWDGRPFLKAVPVDKGRIQALWCGLQVPRDLRPGLYSGTVIVAPKGLPVSHLKLDLLVRDEVLADSGDADPFRMTRLRWLDSRLAFDDEIVPPYTPLKVDGLTVGCLGRSLTIGPDGLPARIRSSFAPEMTRLAAAPEDVTAGPLELKAELADGQTLRWRPVAAAGPRFSKRAPGTVAWEAADRAGGLTLTISAQMEFDGFVGCEMALTANRDIAVSDVRLEVPLKPEYARYMMGLGFKGGQRPETFDWTWDQTKNQDALWLGAVNGGLQVSLRAENYSRPLNTNFYLSKPLNMPPSWGNEGRGGVRVRAVRGASGKPVVLLTAYSGPRTIKAGQTLRFDFTLLLTPFKPLDPAAHFGQRYFHAYKPLDEVAAAGANVINIHHANEINPYINYPFLRPREMKAYIDEAHRRGFKVKIYDTVRELSNRAAELFALRSLGREIFSPGPGGGYSWLQEHLGGDYIAAWFVPELRDAAVINSGMSRWHNSYIEGLDWLAANVGIDGLYLDDVAFDRTTMKRIRKVLDRRRPGALIDLHSANQYNPRDGFASSANLYLEHFPFLNRLWFGEYFDYNGSGPDYWLVEMSGLPFGLMGEMLQDGGNPWRGAVFGMTSRLPWAGDPRPLWKAWDDFGIASSEMVGWWVEKNPVRTGRKDALATVYVRRGIPGKSNTRALVALASWAKEAIDVPLTVDWKALGLEAKTAVFRAPAIDKFQPAAEFRPGAPIRVEPGRGWLLVLGD